MRNAAQADRDHLAKAALALAAISLLGSAAIAARAAIQHMQALGEICGASPLAAHCGWCAATVALALASLATAAAAARPALARIQLNRR